MNHAQIYLLTATALACAADGVAQDLEPRAYSVSPKGVNFGVVGFARTAGGVSFDPSLPIEDASAVLHGTFVAYARAVNFFGRSANVGVTLPYVWGALKGTIDGNLQQARRSGLSNPA